MRPVAAASSSRVAAASYQYISWGRSAPDPTWPRETATATRSQFLQIRVPLAGESPRKFILDLTCLVVLLIRFLGLPVSHLMVALLLAKNITRPPLQQFVLVLPPTSRHFSDALLGILFPNLYHFFQIALTNRSLT